MDETAKHWTLSQEKVDHFPFPRKQSAHGYFCIYDDENPLNLKI